MIGQTVSHYKIIEKLGEGGMGVVYKAEDTKLTRTVALKFLPPELTRDEEAKTRFIHEARAASALQHNNICTIHEIDETPDGRLFISMDCYEGETLKEKIAKGPLPLEETIDIAAQIAEGLSEAHDKGMVHRDIKPGNVMITRKGGVKILDFGLAMASGMTRLTKTGTTVGTVAYMSPEQARGEGVDRRSDLWALSVVLYEMLSGRPPFRADHEQAVLYSILNEEPRPLSDARPDLPPGLSRIIAKGLAKNSGERYVSAAELRADLVHLRNPSVAGRATRGAAKEKEHGRFIARRKTVVGVLGAAVVLVAALIVFGPLKSGQGPFLSPKPIAVISFDNQTGDDAYDYLQKAIPNLLITSLEQSKFLQVTTWERMHDLLGQMGKGEVVLIDRELGFELCRKDGVQAIVLGSFTKAGDVFATDVKVMDVDSKSLLETASARGEGVESILEKQIDELSKRIARGVGLSERKVREEVVPVHDFTTASMDAYNYFLRGREEFDRFYYEEARRFLAKAVELDSTFAAAYLYLGRAHAWMSDSRSRDEAFEKAKRFSVKASDKEKLYIEASYAYYVTRDLERSHRIIQGTVRRYPKEKDARFQLASYYANRMMFKDAEEQLLKTLRLDPNFGLALNELAYLYVYQGNHDRALEYFQRYASACPGDANPFDSMGDLYLEMGKLDNAITKYEEAIEIKPDFHTSFLKGAYVLGLREDYIGALEWIDRQIASTSSPGLRAHGYLWKAFFHYWLGDRERSSAELEEAVALAGEVRNEFCMAYAEWVKGWMDLEAHDFDSSRAHFAEWRDLMRTVVLPYDVPGMPWETDYEFYGGMVDLEQGRMDSARTKLANMSGRVDSVGPAYMQWATVNRTRLQSELLLAEGRHAEAIAVYRDVGSPNIPFLITENLIHCNAPLSGDVLARAYRANGEIDQAIAEYERLVTFDPKSRERRLIHPKYHYRLAKLYDEAGQSSKALAKYGKFLQICKDPAVRTLEVEDAARRLRELGGS